MFETMPRKIGTLNDDPSTRGNLSNFFVVFETLQQLLIQETGNHPLKNKPAPGDHQGIDSKRTGSPNPLKLEEKAGRGNLVKR